jgi:Carboxypeptidase regulatory-like domain/TonB-dependent Receptor Plug Domain
VQEGKRLRTSILALAWAVLVTVFAFGTPGIAAAQGTATIRGTVTDASGGVLPGATVTITNAGTKDIRTAVSDDRGGYTFASLFNGTYELKVELEGFKGYDAKNIVLSPNDTRGLDVMLEVGNLTDVITVSSPLEIIQTETGAREGVLRAEQIDNLSVVSRSSLELLRIMPGVVSPSIDSPGYESVSFGGGANNTQGYTVNGVRSSNNTVSLDGSALIDIGSNSGVIVTLNNDMVQEVKIQSSNFAAEYGAGGVSVSAVTKAGSSQFHGTLYDYLRDSSYQANDRSNSILGTPKPKSKYQYPGLNVGGPILLPGFNKQRNKAFFFVGFEAQRQQVDSGSRLGTVPTLKQRAGDFSESLTSNGSNLGQPVGNVLIPAGSPNAGQAAPGANLSPYVTPIGRVLANLYPKPNLADPRNEHNYVYSRLEPTNRTDLKMRFDYNISQNTKAYVRVAIEGEDVESGRGVWWGASDVELPSTNRGRSYSGNIVSVLSPTMTNEALVSFSRLKLDNTFKDPAIMSLSNYGLSMPGPFGSPTPYIPGVVPSWGGGVSNMWAAAVDMYAHNDELTFSDKVTKIAGAHGFKFGASISRLQKQQNFQNNEEMQLIFAPGWTSGTTGNAVGDILTGRITQFNAGTKSPNGEYRFWNYDFFAQDSWKLKPNFTLEYGVRAGYWPNNEELNGLGGWFDPSTYDASRPQFLDPGRFTRLNGVRYIEDGAAPAGILPNRSPFAMPRVNVAWDLDGNGNNVLRGGYGIFFNRNMGNVEYDNTLRLPPYIYGIGQDAGGGVNYGNGLGLTYTTLPEATLASRLGSVGINTLTPDSFKFPKTHSFSVSYARRIPFDMVLEAAYVGTRGRDLVTRVNGNVIPEGSLLSGTIGNANLSDIVQRSALADTVINARRPYTAYPGITQYDFEGVSNYNSLQVTLSRQTSKRLQYFATYTLSRTKGTLGDEYRNRDPFNPARTYGIRNEDRTHIFNLSWNAFLPDAVSESGPAIGKGLLNGWQLSGISTYASGIPIWLGFSGPAGTNGAEIAYYGTPDITVLTGPGGGGDGLAPVYTCDPRLDGRKVGEKILDISCIGFPAIGEVGDVLPPFDIRTPGRMNHDITLFKNFAIKGDQKLQVRVGVFNIFNMAAASTAVDRNDINLNLESVCNVGANGVPNGAGGTVDNVCDARGGFSFTQNSLDNFGRINIRRGHRIVEFALKYYF